MQTKTAILIGAGDRGANAYAKYALEYPNELKIVAVAEPNMDRRNKMKKVHELDEVGCFKSWEHVLVKERLADIAIICTMDRCHFEPTIKALELGYHVLLEKPMSPDPGECIEMERMSKKYGKQLTICHVLRYTEFWLTNKKGDF